MKRKHVPIYVIDYIIEQLIREKQGRTDYLEKRKNYFFYLLQSYSVYSTQESLFDERFIKKPTGIEISLNSNRLDKKIDLSQSYTELYNLILTVYETFWHYDMFMLNSVVSKSLPPDIQRLILRCHGEDYNIIIYDYDFSEDYLNTSTEWGWAYEINRHGGSGKRPTKEEAMENIKKKWKIIKMKMENKN